MNFGEYRLLTDSLKCLKSTAIIKAASGCAVCCLPMAEYSYFTAGFALAFPRQHDAAVTIVDANSPGREKDLNVTMRYSRLAEY